LAVAAARLSRWRGTRKRRILRAVFRRTIT